MKSSFVEHKKKEREQQSRERGERGKQTKKVEAEKDEKRIFFSTFPHPEKFKVLNHEPQK